MSGKKAPKAKVQSSKKKVQSSKKVPAKAPAKAAPKKKDVKVTKTKAKDAFFKMPKSPMEGAQIKKRIEALEKSLADKAAKADLTALARAVENKAKVADKPAKATTDKVPLAQQPEQVALRKAHPTAFAGVVYATLEKAQQTLSVREIMERAGIDPKDRPYVSSLVAKLVDQKLVDTEQRECSVSGRVVNCVVLKRPKKEKAS